MKSQISLLERFVNFVLNILIFIFGVIILILVYANFQTKILGNNYNDFFGYSFFEVQTGSMADTINPGDLVIVKLTDNIKLNDVVTFRLGSDYITHRVMQILPDGSYVTKGDANNAYDEPVNKNQIIGKVVKIIPGVGIIRKTILEPSVIITILITIWLFTLALKDEKEGKASEIKKERKYVSWDTIWEKTSAFFVYLGNGIVFLTKRILAFLIKVKEIIIKFIVKIRKVIKFLYLKLKEALRLLGEKIVILYSKIKDELIQLFKKLSKLFIKLKEFIKKKAKLLWQILKVWTDKFIKKISAFLVIAKETLKKVFKTLILKLKVGFKVFFEFLKKIFKKVSDAMVLVFNNVRKKVKKIVEDLKNKFKKEEVITTSDEKKEEVIGETLDEELTESIKPEETIELDTKITIDSIEIEKTYLEIAENELKKSQKEKEKEKKKKVVKPKPKKKEQKPKSEDLTELELKILKKNKKASVIEAFELIKEEELTKIMKIILRRDKTFIKMSTVEKKFLKTYIDARYYNFHVFEAVYSSNNYITKIKRTLKKLASKLVEDYKGSNPKYGDIVNKYLKLFALIASLENANISISKEKAKNEFYKKELNKYFKDLEFERIQTIIKNIIEIQNKYFNMLAEFLRKLETNVFSLKYNRLKTKKNIFNVELIHNLTFSKVYSDYIIEKTYKEGIVAEDKMIVLFTLLSIQLINDMLAGNLAKKYMIYLPASLYQKERKLKKLLKMIEDNHSKESIYILITFTDLFKNIGVIKSLRKEGYKFALVLTDEAIIDKKKRENIYIADYIFVSKKLKNYKELVSLIPSDLTKKVIYEDIAKSFGSD